MALAAFPHGCVLHRSRASMRVSFHTPPGALPTLAGGRAATVLHAALQTSTEQWTQLVNLAGRQRMLSQRIVLHALLAAQGDAAARVVAQEALALLESTHETLTRGRPEMPVPESPRLSDAFHGAQGRDSAIRAFVGLAARAVERGAPADVQALAAQATPVLRVLQELTQVYEQLALDDAKVRRALALEQLDRIRSIAREARIATVNAHVAAARAGSAGREFAVTADVLARISEEVERLAKEAAAAG
jgi:hypothetical protein